MRIARHYADVFEMRPKILRNFDEKETTQIDTILAKDKPKNGLTTCASIGLSEHKNWKGKQNSEVYVELCIVGSNHTDVLTQIIASSAFFVMKDKWFASPDTLFPNLFELVDLKTSMQHIMLLSPIDFEDEFRSFEYLGRTIAWLQLIPISDAEYRFALDEGLDSLQSKLELAQVDYTDLQRNCIFSN